MHIVSSDKNAIIHIILKPLIKINQVTGATLMCISVLQLKGILMSPMQGYFFLIYTLLFHILPPK